MIRQPHVKKIDEDLLMSLEKITDNPASSKPKILNNWLAKIMDALLNFWHDPVLACEVLFFTLARPIIKPKW